MQKEIELYKLRYKVCIKKKSKFPIKFKPKILKPNEMKPIEFKNDPEIEELYEIVPKEELPQCDIKNLITKEDDLKRKFNIDDDLIIEPHKNQQSF